MKTLVSPKQLAKAIGVSESSVKRWCDDSQLQATYTPGGHRKIKVAEALDFIRRSNHGLVDPRSIGLPTNLGKNSVEFSDASELLTAALIDGEEANCRRIILDLYLQDTPLETIFDQVLLPAFVEIGAKWGCGEVAIYQERSACLICTKLLNGLEDSIPSPATAPLAIGGTLTGDFYEIPTQMVSLIGRQQGFRTKSLGANLPASTILEAAEKYSPKWVWLSVSYIPENNYFIAEVNQLWDILSAQGIHLVLGGRGLTTDIKSSISYTTCCDSMTDLANFLKIMS